MAGALRLSRQICYNFLVKYYFSGAPKNISLNLLDPALVETNRRGQVSPEQAEWLKSAAWGGSSKRIRVILGILIAVGVLLFVIYAFFTNLNTGVIVVAGLLIAILVAVVLGPRLISALRDSTRVREDLQGGLVRQVTGELVYENGNYKIRAGEQTLSLPSSNNACGLLPGVRYLCYALEASPMLLSAEQLGDSYSGSVRQALNGILAAAHRFQMDDMEANRNGGISSAQRKALIRQAFSSGAGAITGLIFIGAILLPILEQGRLPEDFASLMIPLLVALGILFPAGLAVYRSLADALGGAVAAVQGSGLKSTERRSSGRSSRTVYQYNINDMKLQVPQNAYLALIDGLQYRAYFAPRTHKLLSMEALDLPEPSTLGV